MDKAKREKAKKNVIEVLNKARSMELQAISQYMNQHYNLDDMDYGELAAKVKLIAVDEMRHAEDFAERVKELGGEPTVDPAEKAEKGQKIDTIFPFDSDLEDDTIAEYNQFLKVCQENGDSVSSKIFETIIDDEQAHLNYFENIADHIKELGDTYLAQIAGTQASAGLNSPGFVTKTGRA